MAGDPIAINCGLSPRAETSRFRRSTRLGVLDSHRQAFVYTQAAMRAEREAQAARDKQLLALQAQEAAGEGEEEQA